MQDITSKEPTPPNQITKSNPPNTAPDLHHKAVEELIINYRKPTTTTTTTTAAASSTTIEEKSVLTTTVLQQQESTNQLYAQKATTKQLLTRSQSSKVIQELQQQQSLPKALHEKQTNITNNNSVGYNHCNTTNGGINAQSTSTHHPSKSVSILVYKTLNSVFKNSRKIIFRVCEVASAKKSFTMFKFNKANAQTRAESRANACTGHDQFVRPPMPDKKVKHIMKKMHKQNGLKRSNSAIEFDVSALSAANRRHIYSSNRSASSEQDNSDQSEHSEKSPLVSARLDNLARIFFSKSMPAETGSRDTIDSVLTTRPNIKYQYSALDRGTDVVERSPRERANRELALNAIQEWTVNLDGRYEIMAHLDEIGSRHSKHWFLVNDSSVRTDRLLTLLPLPPDCVALEDVPRGENPKGVLMELLGSLHHPYIYPVLDLGFQRTNSINYACLVTPFNSRGSLKDLIYKAQWNEPWARKYTRKPTNGLPVTQVQRLGRQILEALLFLKERGFPLHGHLHSGNVILQNGAARLSGLENGLLGLSSRNNAVMWSRSTTEIENIDIICFGHLLYEMCTGQEMSTPKPSMRVLEMEMEHYPQILDVLGLIFDPPSGCCPSVEELVLCDLFRSIDLRELRGPCFNTIKPSLSRSTLNLLHAVKKRQCASLGNSFSEASSPCTPPSTPHERRSGLSRTMDSFDIISSDSEEGLLDEIVVGSNYQQQQEYLKQWQRMQYYQVQHLPAYIKRYPSYEQQQQNNNKKETKTQHYYDTMESPIHYCDTLAHSDDNSTQENLPPNCQRLSSKQQNKAPIVQQQQQKEEKNLVSKMNGEDTKESDLQDIEAAGSSKTNGIRQTAMTNNIYEAANEIDKPNGKCSVLLGQSLEMQALNNISMGGGAQSTSNLATNWGNHTATTSHNQLTADMCNYKNSKSRRLEYSLKCLKYGRSNPSQDSAFGSLTDNELTNGSMRLNSFQSISSPIDEGVEDIIIATTTAGKETCLELATVPRSMVSQDSAISSPCRENSPNNFLHIDDTLILGNSSVNSTSSSSTSNMRPQQFPVSLSPKILVTTTTNSSNSSLSSINLPVPTQTPQQAQQQQFDPPKILVNDQNSIYTTSPSKRNSTIEVFSQKYRVSSFEDMSPNRRASEKHLRNVNRIAFRSLEEERRIDSAFMPITERSHSANRVNMQSEKYKKLTHASFRISQTSSLSLADSREHVLAENVNLELQRPATASGTSSSRQAMWRASKFYRKNRIAKSNDSLLETSPNHSMRLSPASLHDNHYESCSTVGSRQSLNHGSSINEIYGSPQQLGMGLTVTNFNSARRYCSSKSEELADTHDYLRVMDARKSYSERHLVTLTKLRQTAINNSTPEGSSEQCYLSEDEMSLNDDNNAYVYAKQYQKKQQQSYTQRTSHYTHQREQKQLQQQQQHEIQQLCAPSCYIKRAHPKQLSWSSCSINRLKTTNIKTTSLATLICQQNLPNNAASASASSNSSSSLLSSEIRSHAFLSLEQTSNTTVSKIGNGSQQESYTDENNSSNDASPLRQAQTFLSTDISRIFAINAQRSNFSEEKTPLLDSVELLLLSPSDGDSEPGEMV